MSLRIPIAELAVTRTLLGENSALYTFSAVIVSGSLNENPTLNSTEYVCPSTGENVSDSKLTGYIKSEASISLSKTISPVLTLTIIRY